MLFSDLQAHAGELLLKLKRRALGGVGQEEKALVLLLKPRNELRYAGQQTVAVIDNTVRIADKALLLAEKFQIFSHIADFSFRGLSAGKTGRRNSLSHCLLCGTIPRRVKKNFC